MSEQNRSPRRRPSGEAEEGSSSSAVPPAGASAPRPNFPSPPQHMPYPGQHGPQQGRYAAYNPYGRPPHVSSMNPSEAMRHGYPPGAPQFGLPSQPGDPRAAASAQQVTPDTRQLFHGDFMSPGTAALRRSPSPGSKPSPTKRPRRAGECYVFILIPNVLDVSVEVVETLPSLRGLRIVLA